MLVPMRIICLLYTSVFSDDLDKALASFVIANGAASTGKKVTMFFTFWGLNVIKKQHKPTVTKDIFGKMFGWMLPTHSGKLKLSKMNMGGAGSWMMRLIMKRKRIDSLESLIQQAIDLSLIHILKLFADLQRLVVLFQLHHRSGTHQSASIYFQQIDLGIGVSIACAFRYFRLVGNDLFYRCGRYAPCFVSSG